MVSVDSYSSPFGRRHLGALLRDNLDSGDWRRMVANVAWVKRSGARHINESLRQFVAGGGIARFAIGIDNRGTTVEGLDMIADAIGPSGEIWIVHHTNLTTTFHPKAFLFENDRAALALVGSGNLTEGGLFTNFEMGAELTFDFRNPDDSSVASGLRAELEGHLRSSPISKLYDASLRRELLSRGDIVTEEQAGETLRDAIRRRVSEPRPPVFGAIPIPTAPRPQTVTATGGQPRSRRRGARTREPTTLPGDIVTPRGFVMTLQQTDAGVGQRTRGASRRSPELFVPLAARDAFPGFWGWPSAFREDSGRKGKFDRAGVSVRLGSDTIQVNMMTWPIKHDFRLRSESLRSAGRVGDILRLERADAAAGFDYYAEIVPSRTAMHPSYDAICTEAVRNSKKRWGYYS